MRFIDAYDVILLDQGKTFMFENDRFGPQEDYADTYRRVGGTALSPTQIRDTVEHVYSTLLKAYRDRYCDDDFPTVKDVIKTQDPSFPSAEADYIDDVIAEHEIGTISDSHQSAIHLLADTHQLGIISNIWGQPSRFEHNLQQAGILGCFEHIVSSSAYRKSKPSRELFQAALDYWTIEPCRILYVGNDPIRDIEIAKAVRMGAAWIDLGSEGRPAVEPDTTIHDLAELSRVMKQT